MRRSRLNHAGGRSPNTVFEMVEVRVYEGAIAVFALAYITKSNIDNRDCSVCKDAGLSQKGWPMLRRFFCRNATMTSPKNPSQRTIIGTLIHITSNPPHHHQFPQYHTLQPSPTSNLSPQSAAEKPQWPSSASRNTMHHGVRKQSSLKLRGTPSNPS